MAIKHLTDGDNLFFDDAQGNTIHAMGGNDTVYGQGGHDIIYDGPGNDTLYGGPGDDRLYAHDVGEGQGEEGYDEMAYGGDGADYIEVYSDGGAGGRGDAGNDTIRVSASYASAYGGIGNDRLWVSSDNPYADGGVGDDFIEIGVGEDGGGGTGGPGHDRMYGEGNWGGLYGGTGNDHLEWTQGYATTLAGEDGNDMILGSHSENTERDEPEQLWGGRGADVIYGRGGADYIIGGPDKDRLYGGPGDGLQDTLDFNNVAESTPGAKDLIGQFGQEDLINLAGIDANTGRSGDQAFSFIGSAAFSAVGQVRFYKANGDTFVQASNDGDRAAEFEVELDQLPFALTSGDFVL